MSNFCFLYGCAPANCAGAASLGGIARRSYFPIFFLLVLVCSLFRPPSFPFPLSLSFLLLLTLFLWGVAPFWNCANPPFSPALPRARSFLDLKKQCRLGLP